MAVAKGQARKTARKRSALAGPRPADVFVIFGITGDLAKVMTFNSLYRLEARGLLDCPIVGVAFDDWSEKDLREHARKAIQTSSGKKPDPKVFNRLAKRLLLCAGRLLRRRHLRAGREGDQGRQDPGLLSGDPAVPVRDDDRRALQGGADGERAGGGGEAVRPRPPVGARSRRRDPPVHPRGPALPDRPLPRPDGSGGDPLLSASRTRCSSPSGTATASTACRSRWPRTSASRIAAASTTRSAPSGTSWSTT